MNISRFIASRIDAGGISAFIVRMASVAVAISMAVMIISVSISDGYDQMIRKKVFGFMGHISIETDRIGFAQEAAMSKDSIFFKPLDLDEVELVNYYAEKPGLLKTDELMHGIIYKGVEKDFQWNFFEDYLVEGDFPKEKNDVLISTALQQLLNYTIGDKVIVHFIQEPLRTRALTICGFYNTNLVEFDEQIIFSSIEHIRTLNQWQDDGVGGVEIFVKNPYQATAIADKIQREYVKYDKFVRSIEQTNSEIFDWLTFIKTNQWIVLSLMAIVAIINMISMLLVMILERTKMIGVLKALGSSESMIRWVFVRKAIAILLIGLLLGNFIGIGLSILQYYGKVIELDPDLYFLSHVPVHIQIHKILALNVATILIIFVTLFIPTLMIRKISPIRVLRFE